MALSLVLDMCVTDVPVVDREVFGAWLARKTLAEATQEVLDRRGLPSSVRTFVHGEVVDQFRLYEHLLAPLLAKPASLGSQNMVTLTPDDTQWLLEDFYAFSGPVFREILGKKLTSKTRRDLDDVAEKTGVDLLSCQRQFDNLRAIFLTAEQFLAHAAEPESRNTPFVLAHALSMSDIGASARANPPSRTHSARFHPHHHTRNIHSGALSTRSLSYVGGGGVGSSGGGGNGAGGVGDGSLAFPEPRMLMGSRSANVSPVASPGSSAHHSYASTGALDELSPTVSDRDPPALPFRTDSHSGDTLDRGGNSIESLNRHDGISEGNLRAGPSSSGSARRPHVLIPQSPDTTRGGDPYASLTPLTQSPLPPLSGGDPILFFPPGTTTLEEVISGSFSIPLELAARYVRALIFVGNRIEVSKKRLQFLTYDDLDDLADVLARHWITPTPSSSAPQQQLGAGLLTWRIDARFADLMRDIKSVLMDRETLESYRRAVLARLKSTRAVSKSSVASLKPKLKELLRTLISIGAGLSQPKEFRDILIDIYDGPVELLSAVDISLSEITPLFEVLQQTFSGLENLQVRNRRSFLSPWRRYLSAVSEIVMVCLNRKPSN